MCTNSMSILCTLDFYDLDLSYISGNTKGGSITVLLTSCLTGLESAVWQLSIFVFICKTDLSKPVKQEVNGKVILPPLVFPVYFHRGSLAQWPQWQWHMTVRLNLPRQAWVMWHRQKRCHLCCITQGGQGKFMVFFHQKTLPTYMSKEVFTKFLNPTIDFWAEMSMEGIQNRVKEETYVGNLVIEMNNTF